MNRTGFKLAVALFSVSLSSGGLARGQENPAPPTPDRPKIAKQEPKKGKAKKLNIRLRTQIAMAQRLRQMMDEKIELTPTQATAIDRWIHDWTEDVANAVDPRLSAAANRPDNKVLPPFMLQLEREQTRAKNAGDDAKVQSIEQQKSMLRREPAVLGDDLTESLTAKIKTELTPEQAAVYENVVKRWDAIVPRGTQTGPFYQLVRAIDDPEVGLSPEQKEEATKLLQRALKDARSSGKDPKVRLAENIEKTKKIIYGKMTDEQRRKIEADLRFFEESERDPHDLKSSKRGAARRAGVTANDGEKKDPPTDSKPKPEGQPTSDSAAKP